MKKQINMKEIAEKAQVSVTTVSNVLHGRHRKVSKETYEKVSEIIRENDYQYSVRARLLAGQKQLLFVILDFRSRECSSNYEKMREIIEGFYEKGIITLLYFPASIEEGSQIVRMWDAAGVIVIGDFKVKEKIYERNHNCTIIRISGK